MKTAFLCNLIIFLMFFCSAKAGTEKSIDANMLAMTDEPTSVKELRKAILDGPHGKEPIHRTMEMLISSEGDELQDTYLALNLRKQEALPIILERLKSEGPAAKRKITKLLRYSHWPEAVPTLLEVADSNSEHELSRIGSLYALGAIGEKSAAPTIASLLDKPGRGTMEKRIIISTLARLKYRQAVPLIQPYLTHDNMLVRIFAARALAELGQTVEVTMLFNALQNQDYVIRQEACGALGAVGTPDVITPLTEAAERDPHSSVRLAATLALRQIEISSMPENLKADSLEKLAGDSDNEIRHWAIQTLATENGESGKVKLRKMAGQHTPAAKEIAVQLLLMEGASNNAAVEVEP